MMWDKGLGTLAAFDKAGLIAKACEIGIPAGSTCDVGMVRHCVLACELEKSLGYQPAKEILDHHEEINEGYAKDIATMMPKGKRAEFMKKFYEDRGRDEVANFYGLNVDQHVPDSSSSNNECCCKCRESFGCPCMPIAVEGDGTSNEMTFPH